MDRLRRLELMTRAAEAGSFSRAAQLLQLDPSSISHAVAELEKDLGFRLFHRTTRQLKLTDEGRDVLRRAQAILQEVDEIQNLAPRDQQQLEGTLRIGMSVSVSRHVMMPRMAEFMQRHPKLRIESLMLDQTKDLHAAGLDVMFVLGALKDSGLIAQHVGTLRLAVYAAPSYLERAGDPKHPEELVHHACLIHKPPFTAKGWNDWRFTKGRQRLNVKVPMNLMTDDREGLVAAALSGAGIMRIGMLDQDLVERGRLQRVLSDWECPGGPEIHLLYRKSPRLDPRVKAFLEFVDEVFSDFDPQERSLRVVKRGRSSKESPSSK